MTRSSACVNIVTYHFQFSISFFISTRHNSANKANLFNQRLQCISRIDALRPLKKRRVKISIVVENVIVVRMQSHDQDRRLSNSTTDRSKHIETHMMISKIRFIYQNSSSSNINIRKVNTHKQQRQE